MRNFKRTNGMLKVLAIGILTLFILPQYVAATDVATNAQTINYQFDGMHQSQNDEVVNMANDSAITNPPTWNPTYQGIWIGGATKESLYELNDVTAAGQYSGGFWFTGSALFLSTEITFAPSDIMNGASQTVVRLPIYVEPGMSNCSLLVYKLASASTYAFNAPVFSSASVAYIEVRTGGSLVDPIVYNQIDLTDFNVTDGNDQYVRDNRCYYILNAPIESSVHYLFVAYVEYPKETSFKLYLSQDDVANDHTQMSNISYYIIDPPGYVWHDNNYSVDLGWSFDCRIGLGYGMTAKDFYLTAGEEIVFLITVPYLRWTNGYHVLMLPFLTANNSAKLSFNVYDAADNHIWDHTAWVYQDYICVSSNTEVNLSQTDAIYDTVKVVVESKWTQQIRLFFWDSGLNIFQPESYAMIGEHLMRFHLFAYYELQDAQVVLPNAIHGANLLNPPPPNKPWISAGGFMGLLITGVGVFLVLTGYGAPLGAALIGIGLGYTVAHEYFQNTQFGDWVRGWAKPAVDAIWGALLAVGHFLWSVGEAIWGALTWLWNAIMQYGAYLLGLIIVAVALFIFFYFVNWQIKLWATGLLMAQGKFTAAGREMSGMTKEISSTGKKGLRLFTKVGRRLK